MNLHPILPQGGSHRAVLLRIAGQNRAAQELALQRFFERWMKGWEEHS